MGLLGVLHLAVIPTGFICDVVVTKHLGGLTSSGVNGFTRESRRVGTHVGNPTLFVQTLRRSHRALGVEAKFATRLNLERGGHEGWLWALRAGRRGDRFDRGALSSQLLRDVGRTLGT